MIPATPPSFGRIPARRSAAVWRALRRTCCRCCSASNSGGCRKTSAARAGSTSSGSLSSASGTLIRAFALALRSAAKCRSSAAWTQKGCPMTSASRNARSTSREMAESSSDVVPPRAPSRAPSVRNPARRAACRKTGSATMVKKRSIASFSSCWLATAPDTPRDRAISVKARPQNGSSKGWRDLRTRASDWANSGGKGTWRSAKDWRIWLAQGSSRAAYPAMMTRISVMQAKALAGAFRPPRDRPDPARNPAAPSGRAARSRRFPRPAKPNAAKPAQG